MTTCDSPALLWVAQHDRHDTEVGEPFLQNGTFSQRGTDQENAERRAIHETVANLIETIRCHQERRSDPRILFVQPVLITLECSPDGANDEDRILATTIDISFSGVGLLSPSPLSCKLVVLHILDVRLMAEVCWSREIGNRAHRCGLRFVKVVASSI